MVPTSNKRCKINDERAGGVVPVGTRSEHWLLLSCSRAHIDPDKDRQIRRLLGEKVDWDYLVHIADRHGVLPLLCRNLGVYPDAIPRDVLDRIRDYFSHNAYRNCFLKDELLRLLHLFSAHKIRAIPYKGPVLAAVVYGDLSLRQCSDLDILIDESDVPQARDLLLSQGYRPDPVHQLDWEAHFVHENAMFLVDLHWGISAADIYRKRDASFAIDTQGLWERLVRVPFFETEVAHFSPEDLLMIRCQDAVKEYWKDGWPQLKWICDIAEILHKYQDMDWDQVNGQAVMHGNRRLLSFCLLLASDLMGAVLPDAVCKTLGVDPKARSLALEIAGRVFDGDRTSNRYTGRKRGFIERNLFCIMLKERPRDRTIYYLRLLREYCNNARRALLTKEDQDLLLLPKSLRFLYYPLAGFFHLLRPVWRIFRYGLRHMKIPANPGS
jgi:hypothetical protein